ncbi:MAG: type I methionyl aminopeptidase [Chloroflexi bacterium]|nr:type I methionyl aminopeptidase [Chloroflexota bacterium]
MRKSKFLQRKRQERQEESFILKTADEILLMREANRLVAQAFARIGEMIKPGVVLRHVDEMVEAYIREQGGLPLYKGYRGSPPSHPPFPGVICASVNSEICHGFPDGRILREGDIVGIDIGLRYHDFCGDSCVTYAVGEVKPAVRDFLRVAEECLYVGIQAAKVNSRLGELGAAIQAHAEKHGYSVVQEYGGHGIGRALHEPLSVPHHGPARYGPRLQPGMVFTIEPMVNMGKAKAELMPDGWTVKTVDGSLSAQYEHTIAITENGPLILSVV